MNYNSKKAEDVKKQALKDAEYWHTLAQEQGSWQLYERAGQYFYMAGMNAKANACWDAADKLQREAGK